MCDASFVLSKAKTSVEASECRLRLQNAECRMQTATAKCRMQKSCPPCVCSLSCIPWKLLEGSKMRISQADAFTPWRHFEFGLRVQSCSQSPSVQSPSPKGLPLQSSTATSECRSERGVEVEVRDFTSECRMQSAGRARH